MAEFYDELFNVPDIPDFDVDVIFPNGDKVEMFLPTKPIIGDMLRGFIIDKIELSENYKDGDFYGRIILKPRKE